MSVSWNLVPPLPVLGGADGELVSVRVFVAPHLLEDLLEALASLSFPVNPQIYHGLGPDTLVEFPAYSGRLGEVRNVLAGNSFDATSVIIRPMPAELSPAAASPFPN